MVKPSVLFTRASVSFVSAVVLVSAAVGVGVVFGGVGSDHEGSFKSSSVSVAPSPSAPPASSSSVSSGPVVSEGFEGSPPEEPSVPVQPDPSLVPRDDTVFLSPVWGLYDQAAVDTGSLVVWSTDPLILAGHVNRGWDFIDDLSVGTVVQVDGFGTFEVYDHLYLDGKVHFVDELPFADLILQTCTDNGLGFSLAKRVG